MDLTTIYIKFAIRFINGLLWCNDFYESENYKGDIVLTMLKDNIIYHR